MKLNVIIFLICIGANDGENEEKRLGGVNTEKRLGDVNTEKKLVLEMDIEQEIINLKQSLAKKDAEISALNSLVTDLQQKIGKIHILSFEGTRPLFFSENLNG